ncbi:MAG: hypothetical protein ACTSXX_03490 [Candidatus Baldrarchaeia archaeon]
MEIDLDNSRIQFVFKIINDGKTKKIEIQSGGSSKIVAEFERLELKLPTEPLLLVVVDFLRTIVRCATTIELSDNTGKMRISRIDENTNIITFSIICREEKRTAERKEYVLERFTSLLFDFIRGDITVERVYKNSEHFYIHLKNLSRSPSSYPFLEQTYLFCESSF